MDDAIVVEGLSKQFRRYPKDRPRTLKEVVVGGIQRLRPPQSFWALRDVSFRVAPGRMVGIIGPNGAGKSTLLRLIGGVGLPDKGKVTVHGQIGSLLEIGSGFHPDLTGRENVFVSGVIDGLTRREVAQRFDEIVDFAELDDFIDSPLRTYSTGMQMRLGFSVAVHTAPDILLIDEILAVGDLSFQRKCIKRITQFRDEGSAILLVSHDAESIQELCDEAIWLDRGRLLAHGPPDVVTGQYIAEMSAETERRTPNAHPVQHTPGGVELRVNVNRFGSMEMQITAVHLLDAQGLPVTEMYSGDPLIVKMEYSAPKPIESPIFGVTIIRADGTICYDTSTAAMEVEMPTIDGTGSLQLHIERLDLIADQYFMNVWVFERQWRYAYDSHGHAYPFHVHQTAWEKGIIRPPASWEFGDGTALRNGVPETGQP